MPSRQAMEIINWPRSQPKLYKVGLSCTRTEFVSSRIVLLLQVVEVSIQKLPLSYISSLGFVFV